MAMDLDEAWYIVKLTSQQGDTAEPDSYQAREIVQDAIGKYKQVLLAYNRLTEKMKGDPDSPTVPLEFYPSGLKDYVKQ